MAKSWAVGTAQRSDQNAQRSGGMTLGDILYADKAKVRVSETEWVNLVRSVASGDQRALHSLYEQTHRIVFTLIVRIIANAETAEEVTLDVFHDVWRKASTYDPADGSVVGWIMNQARCRAIDRLRFDQRKKRSNTYPHSLLPTTDIVDPQQASVFEEQRRLLRTALDILTPEERNAIETAFFSELTYEETAKKLNQPVGTVKTRIRSATCKTARCHGQRNRRQRMNSRAATHNQEHLDLLFLFALQALPAREVRRRRIPNRVMRGLSPGTRDAPADCPLICRLVYGCIAPSQIPVGSLSGANRR